MPLLPVPPPAQLHLCLECPSTRPAQNVGTRQLFPGHRVASGHQILAHHDLASSRGSQGENAPCSGLLLAPKCPDQGRANSAFSNFLQRKACKALSSPLPNDGFKKEQACYTGVPQPCLFFLREHTPLSRYTYWASLNSFSETKRNGFRPGLSWRHLGFVLRRCPGRDIICVGTRHTAVPGRHLLGSLLQFLSSLRGGREGILPRP